MTQSEITDAIWAATVRCLGMDPDSDDETVQKIVRKSWPSPGLENSNWKPDENVVFLRVTSGTDHYGDLHDVCHDYDADTDQQKAIVIYHRSHRVTWICYGPDADDYADSIRIGVIQPGIREYLAQFKIAIKPHIPEPVRAPEQDETGEIWERSDLVAEFYQLETREYAEDFIDGIPEINLM